MPTDKRGVIVLVKPDGTTYIWEEETITTRAYQVETDRDEDAATAKACEFLAGAFDEPCNWTFGGVAVDELMLDRCGEWCEKHCGDSGAECWKKFFEVWNEGERCQK